MVRTGSTRAAAPVPNNVSGATNGVTNRFAITRPKVGIPKLAEADNANPRFTADHALIKTVASVTPDNNCKDWALRRITIPHAANPPIGTARTTEAAGPTTTTAKARNPQVNTALTRREAGKATRKKVNAMATWELGTAG